MTTRKLFITGTDTGVGKTYVTTWLLRELQTAGIEVGAYKPVCSGSVATPDGPLWEDADQLATALRNRFPRERIAPQCFHAPLAPPVAASLQGSRVDEESIMTGADWWNGRVELLLIEGAGGWLSPVSEAWTNADLASQLEADVIIVAGNRLGVINHMLLTLDHVRRSRRVVGSILNQPAPPPPSPVSGFDPLLSNLQEIERRSGIPFWGSLGFQSSVLLAADGSPRPLDWRTILELPDAGGFSATGPKN